MHILVVLIAIYFHLELESSRTSAFTEVQLLHRRSTCPCMPPLKPPPLDTRATPFFLSRAPSFTYFWAAASPRQLQHHFGSSIIPLHLSHVVLLFLLQLLVPLAVWDQDGCFVVAHSAMSGRPLSTRSFVLLQGVSLLLAGCLSLSPYPSIHLRSCWASD